jgi:DNA-binding SARP family transcriptional activator/TolB-like protein
MLGPLTVYRGGMPVELPRSRKVRALTAYLALAPRAASRSKLCELLWDCPSDPRGELRWCLSRLRRVVDEPGRRRVGTHGEFVSFELSHVEADVLEIDHLLDGGVSKTGLEALRRSARLFSGELLEGLHLDDSPLFTQWLGAERRRLCIRHAAVLGEIVQRLAEDKDQQLVVLEQWLKVDPFERKAHELLLGTLVRLGRSREAQEHLAATMRLFELEGLDWLSLREAWRVATRRERTSVVQIDSSHGAPSAPPTLPESPTQHRASVCVMPFLEQADAGVGRSSLGDGLADDVITRLAKLRVLFVIARGTAFSLVDRTLEAAEAARILNVDYVVSGLICRRNGRILAKVELAETQRPRIVWADVFDCPQSAALRGIDEMGNAIVAAIAEEVEAAERNRAILKPPSSLDAWEAYHRGLWHIYRFNKADNDRAEHFFRMSARLDPTFARAHAGLSFAHFQNAFLHHPEQRLAYIDQAFEAASQSLLADDRDPSAHWAMGRALWLRGRESESLSELALSVDLSPNFVLGHYTTGFVHSQSGDARIAIGSVDHSRRLSPFDPLLFAMLATRALAQMRLGDFDDAAGWAIKAAARPNAHAHILAIAAYCLAVAGRADEART